MKILDCTLRDGGYYTNWDFNSELVEVYLDSFNHLPVDYLEIGYRSPRLSGYLGEFFYCPDYLLRDIKERSDKKIVIILNEKDIRVDDIDTLLDPCLGLIDMVRIAVDPRNFSRALLLAEVIKKKNFEIGFNVMYMSTWSENKAFLSEIKEVSGLADYFYMVDSFGGVYPEDVKSTFEIVRSQTDTKIGFHGHNNLELGLINTITAIECGVDIVDATITGMGRGAGNLKTELLLTVLNSKGHLQFDYNQLMRVVDMFMELQKEYDWGTNMPYMVSGSNSLPQKEVMEWVSTKYYSFNSIIRALTNKSKGIEDNQSLEKIDFDKSKSTSVLVVGGGPSILKHKKSIINLLAKNPEITIIHASSRFASEFKSLDNPQFYCLVGNEGYRLEKSLKTSLSESIKAILPPFPRKMGTYIPTILENKTFELEEVGFTDLYKDSHTALALQTVINIKAKEVFVIGYDGYAVSSVTIREQELFLENEYLFNKLLSCEMEIRSLTPTRYKGLVQDSIYAKLM